MIRESNKLIMNERYSGLDILKALSAFAVVCIHTGETPVCGGAQIALCRFSVPIFFMITGFFYCGTVKRNKEIKQIKKIFFMLVGSMLLYLLWLIVTAIKGDSIGKIKEVFTIKSAVRFLIFNAPPFGGHLWYLAAVLYVLVIVWILRKLVHDNYKKVLYAVTPVLLLGDLVIGKYSLLIFGREFPYIIVRNFLFVGIPYFTIGLFLREKENFILNINKAVRALFVILFVITNIAEHNMLVWFNINAERDHYISTTLLAVALFSLFMDSSWNVEGLSRVKKIGRDYSALIYIIHPIFIVILLETAIMLKVPDNIYGVIAPFIVFAISCAAYWVVLQIKKRIALKKQANF